MNLSRKLINLCESIINEAQYNGHYYISGPKSIEEWKFDRVSPEYFIDSNNRYVEKYKVTLNKDTLINFKKGLDTHSYAYYTYNYIYEYTNVPFKALNVDDPIEMQRAYEKGLIRSIEIPKYSEYKHFMVIDKFLEVYKGISKGNEIFLFLSKEEHDEFPNNLKLVDGAAIRNNIGTEDNLVIPDFVIEGLKVYTDMSNKRLKPNVKDWLLVNTPKPYNSITIYRGTSTGFEVLDYDSSKIEPKEWLSVLKKRYGIKSFDDLRQGAKITMKRGKESSWSTSPLVAQNFGSGGEVNLMVKAEVPASQVIIDFNQLPKNTLTKHFKFFPQSEIIIDKGPIEATISTIYYSEQMINWAKDNGIVLPRVS